MKETQMIKEDEGKMIDLFQVKGKKAIVTGGSRGLGRAMAEGLKDAGAEVVIMGTNESVFETAKALSDGIQTIHGVIADFKDQSAIETGFEEACALLGDIDILVNNAGTQIRHKSEDFPLEDWETVINVNLTATFLLCQLAGKKMLSKKSGKIINIASLLSFSGGLTVPAYAASKGGVMQLTKALSNEWAASGVNVNAIAPGYMKTDNTRAIRENEVRRKQILERIPAGRWGEAEDILGALLFLSSRASDYVNGTIVTVDGGWMGR